ncbi:uncharacterized protein LOC128674720 [Plodia interpunctella]|uniref:uncharacterized protein LOC128674720 n=1 Tax=Plodia interpunctella TaxID=58824 RepID=UPI0023684195|nr:uncharacterized protein LOC128674720 [Plodia interpunctella]
MDSPNTNRKQKNLKDVLSDEQVDCIIRKMLGSDGEWRVTSSEVKPAADGMTGFLGDHLRVTLNVAAGDVSKTIQLFIKRLPTDNPDKVDWIAEYNFFKKEAMVCELLDKLHSDNDTEPWCVKTLIATNSIVVMPDMRPLGYINCKLPTLDLPHLLLAAASVARFHATTTNYEKNKVNQNKPWTFLQDHAEILIDRQFNSSKDAPFMRASAKVTANVIKTFSNKYNEILDLESRILKLFTRASASLREHENTLNVLLHKDLWNANILFRYEQGEPVSALIIDYQCLCYGPPAFDLMILLCCTTSRTFRDQHELTVLRHYYKVLTENFKDTTKQKLVELGYDAKEFLQWCEKARMFAVMQAAAYYPFLMDPITAQKVYDDPKKFKEVILTDRTVPVLEYCRQNPWFLERLLEISEEFVEKYLDK